MQTKATFKQWMNEITILHLLELSESVHKFQTIKIIKTSEMKLFVNALRKYGETTKKPYQSLNATESTIFFVIPFLANKTNWMICPLESTPRIIELAHL